MIVDAEGTVLLCLHHWGPSGPKGDHEWPSLMNPISPPGGDAEECTARDSGAPDAGSGGGPTAGNGLLLWFVVQTGREFDVAWERAQHMGATIVEPPNTDNGTGLRAFLVRDLDGYEVAINEARE